MHMPLATLSLSAARNGSNGSSPVPLRLPVGRSRWAYTDSLDLKTAQPSNTFTLSVFPEPRAFRRLTIDFCVYIGFYGANFRTGGIGDAPVTSGVPPFALRSF